MKRMKRAEIFYDSPEARRAEARMRSSLAVNNLILYPNGQLRMMYPEIDDRIDRK